jgi:hypothetical protein
MSRPGEEPCELGNDKGWVFQLKKLIDMTPLPANITAAIAPLAELGIDMDMLSFVLEDTRPELAPLPLLWRSGV